MGSMANEIQEMEIKRMHRQKIRSYEMSCPVHFSARTRIKPRKEQSLTAFQANKRYSCWGGHW